MLDNKLVFSAVQAVTANGNTNSTNDIDLGALVDDRGSALGKMGPEAGDLFLLVTVGTAFAGGTDLIVTLTDSSDDSTYVNTEIVSQNNIAANLTANAIILNVPLPKQLSRYLRLLYTITTGTMTAGTINAQITMGHQSDLTHITHAAA